MVRYRNVRHGRVLERAAADEWLEASDGWERLEDDEPEASGVEQTEQNEGSKD